MKKCIAFGMTACMLLGAMAVSGCAKKKLADESPNKDIRSVLSDLKKKTEDSKYSLQGEIQIYDGTTMKFTSFHNEMKSLVEDLSKADFDFVGDWDPSKVTFPVYNFQLEAFDISKSGELTIEERAADHTHFDAFWSNGYLVTDSGDAWKCALDFSNMPRMLGEFFTLDHPLSTMPAYDRMTALWNDKWSKENMMTLDEYLAAAFEAPQTIS